jgi:hypothetical protein
MYWCKGNYMSEIGIAFSFLAAPLVEEDDDDAMDTSGPGMNGK